MPLEANAPFAMPIDHNVAPSPHRRLWMTYDWGSKTEDYRLRTMNETSGNCDNETFAHSNFRIGTEFYTEAGPWRCTDVGTRTIVAVKIKDGYPSPKHQPPFSDAVEVVFDEYDFDGLYRRPVED